ncbi:cysteine-rich receptor-like protein kinase [Trifolium pratense]|uniref:Cysteine-rich receptor-like protein kinase n=1 Tax=Trifolium pratense TaxID=57577 RepID=A0A2K3KS98_TRIPR|nr:cysteine-rich receptor-like protein kinase [Trifolium pratense]
MWFRVLAARYGVERGRLRAGGRHGYVSWREISSIREGVGVSEGRWYGDHVVRRVRDGVNTFFWTDSWVDEVPLSERFERLFELAETKPFTVVEMFYRGHSLQIGGSGSQTPIQASLSVEHINS